MRRLLVLLGSALIIGGCSVTPPPSPAGTAIATARPTPTPVSGEGICRTDETLTVRQYLDADPVCFEDNDVTIRAWLDTPPPMGFEGPAIEPAWLAYPPDNNSALWQAPPMDPEHICNADRDSECAWFFLHISPRGSLEGELLVKRWVIVTGHIRDPEAETCHYVELEGNPEPLPPDNDAVAHCRAQFAVTGLGDAP